MGKRYRLIAYFLAALVVGAVLLNWLTSSLRVPSAPGVLATPQERLPAPAPSPSPSPQSGPSQPAADSAGSYSPSHIDVTYSEDQSSEPPTRPIPSRSESEAANAPGSSADQAPAPGISTPSADQGSSTDRQMTTTSPQSSNAALREKLLKKRH